MCAGPAQAPPPHPPLRARSLRSLRAQPQPRSAVQDLSGNLEKVANQHIVSR